MDDEIIRIMVTTDNHLGVYERDPVRSNDCYAAFEEVLVTAREKKVDLVLIAGDIFHENKPTRRTLHSTMELLRKYCLGCDPVYTTVLNEQKELFKANFGRVNYEDPYQSVSLPVYAVHGNHDDPTREGGHGDSLAALDLFAINNSRIQKSLNFTDGVTSDRMVPTAAHGSIGYITTWHDKQEALRGSAAHRDYGNWRSSCGSWPSARRQGCRRAARTGI